MDDIGVFSDSWHEHMETLDRVYTALENNGFTVNPRKCEWAVQQTDFLGHWFTPEGVKPWQRKIDAILALQPPKTLKQLRSFLGMVNYYRDMWPRRSHILSPLTQLTSTKHFTWGPPQQQAFEQMKALIAADTLLQWPDPHHDFHIETDASDYQLGAVIKQHGRPVAYYSRKLSQAQRNYTTIEKELLSVVETLKEFRPILLGAQIHIHTDHRNITHKLTQFSTQRVLRWRLLLKEYAPTFHYKKGSLNVIADALSRVPTSSLERESPAPQSSKLNQHTVADCQYSIREHHEVMAIADCGADGPAAGQNQESKAHQATIEDCRTAGPADGQQVNTLASPASILEAQPKLLEVLLQHPTFDEEGRFPFQFKTIRTYQLADSALQQQLRAHPERYLLVKFGQEELICVEDQNDPKIVIPDKMLSPLIQYFHEATSHVEGMQ
ncbi:MAG: ribonuclease H family protein [Pseudomonadota bacterium]